MTWTQLVPIISPVLGGCIAAAAGMWLASLRRSRDGRDRFLAVVGEIESQLDSCDHIDDRTQTVHADSLAPLRLAIYAVQPFISRRSFNRLLVLWRSYKREQADARTALEKLAAHDIAERSPKGAPAYPDDMLRSYFRKFRAEVG